MELGRHLRELWRLRAGAVVCALLGLIAALSLSYKISIFPPGLSSRTLQMASASTEALVDTPHSTVLDLRQDLFDIESLTNRAVLLGNVMASEPVVAYIARRAGVPAAAIRVTTPRTPNSPRPITAPGEEAKTSDLVRSTNQYRVSIIADPTVPILRIYSQAPTAKAAGELANAVVDGTRDYLDREASTLNVAQSKQVRFTQLGRAHGAVINKGVRLQVTLLSFLIVSGLAAAAAIFMSRVHRGWKVAEEEEGHGDPPGGAMQPPRDRARDVVMR